MAGTFFYKKMSNKSDITYMTQEVVRGNIEKVVNATGEIGAVELVDVGA